MTSITASRASGRGGARARTAREVAVNGMRTGVPGVTGLLDVVAVQVHVLARSPCGQRARPCRPSRRSGAAMPSRGRTPSTTHHDHLASRQGWSVSSRWSRRGRPPWSASSPGGRGRCRSVVAASFVTDPPPHPASASAPAGTAASISATSHRALLWSAARRLRARRWLRPTRSAGGPRPRGGARQGGRTASAGAWVRGSQAPPA